MDDACWYTNFGDICFFLQDPTDKQLNLYWQVSQLSRVAGSARCVLTEPRFSYAHQGRLQLCIRTGTCSHRPGWLLTVQLQVQGELYNFLKQASSSLERNTDYELAVVGVNCESEHEDECYLTGCIAA